MVQRMDPLIPSLLSLALEVGKLQKKTHTVMAVDMVELMCPIIGVGEHPMMAGGGVMSPSPIIEVVMSPSPIIGVVEHPAMAGGVISPIITGVVEHPAMAVDMVGGIISLSPIIGVEDQKSSLQMQIQIQILALLSLSTVRGAMSPIIGVGEHPKMAGGVVMSQSPIIGVVMSPSPIIGVVEHQK